MSPSSLWALAWGIPASILFAFSCGTRTPLYEYGPDPLDAEAPDAHAPDARDAADAHDAVAEPIHDVQPEVCIPLGGKCWSEQECCGLHCIVGTCVVKQTWCGKGEAPFQLAGLGEPLDEYGVDADVTHVYFATKSGVLMRVSKAGGAPETLAAGLSQPMSLLVDDTHVYVADDTTMWRVPKSGGALQSLAPSGGPVMGICDTYEQVYWTSFTTGILSSYSKLSESGEASPGFVHPIGVAIGSIIADNGLNAIVRTSTAGPPTLVAKTEPSPWGVASDGPNLFWSTACSPGCGTIGSLDGDKPIVLLSGLDSPMGVILDAVSVYWMEQGNGNGRIGSMPKKGGAPVSVVSQLGQASFRLTVDNACVYWTDASGRVMRAPKAP